MKKQMLLALLLTSMITMQADTTTPTPIAEHTKLLADKINKDQFIAAYLQAVEKFTATGKQSCINIDILDYKNFETYKTAAEAELAKYQLATNYKVRFLMGRVQTNNSQNILIVVSPVETDTTVTYQQQASI